MFKHSKNVSGRNFTVHNVENRLSLEEEPYEIIEVWFCWEMGHNVLYCCKANLNWELQIIQIDSFEGAVLSERL